MTEKFEVNYEVDIAIDDTALDVEWVEQPLLMMKYSRIAADAQKELGLAKEERDLHAATLSSQIRAKPDKWGITGKLTENMIKACIAQDADYKEMVVDVIEAQHALDIANGAVWALNHKKDALQALVKLHGQKYFAGPSVPVDLSKRCTDRRKLARKQADAKVEVPKRKRTT